MEATEWIIVLVVVLVVAALVAWLVAQQRRRKQQEHAEQLRSEAHEHATEIPETQVRAKEAEAEAEAEGDGEVDGPTAAAISSAVGETTPFSATIGLVSGRDATSSRTASAGAKMPKP